MESVRWTLFSTPGLKSKILKTVPFSIMVNLPSRLPMSMSDVLSAGVVCVVQMLQENPLGRPSLKWVQFSSIFTTARPVSSCPVITRLTLTVSMLRAPKNDLKKNLQRQRPCRGDILRSLNFLKLKGSQGIYRSAAHKKASSCLKRLGAKELHHAVA